MSTLSIRLFGKFSAQLDTRLLDGLEASRLQELFSYLLLYRSRPHPRETLAALLWGDSPTATSKKYLRQTLWQLQTALSHDSAGMAPAVLIVEQDWIRIAPNAGLWLDVAEFEQSFGPAHGLTGGELSWETAQSLERAVRLYAGDLLEGCYEEWCIYERERLQNLLLAMLDKLMTYCESNRQYETGLEYGSRILGFDRAREHTHRRLMRLQYLAGNRTAALRQYDRCVAALAEELGVKPARKTVELYELIRADALEDSTAAASLSNKTEPEPSPFPEVLRRLTQIRTLLKEIRQEIRKDIDSVDVVIKDRRLGS